MFAASRFHILDNVFRLRVILLLVSSTIVLRSLASGDNPLVQQLGSERMHLI
jgi:hypothetical protein